jgi:hypothetical protein
LQATTGVVVPAGCVGGRDAIGSDPTAQSEMSRPTSLDMKLRTGGLNMRGGSVPPSVIGGRASGRRPSPTPANDLPQVVPACSRHCNALSLQQTDINASSDCTRMVPRCARTQHKTTDGRRNSSNNGEMTPPFDLRFIYRRLLQYITIASKLYDADDLHAPIMQQQGMLACVRYSRTNSNCYTVHHALASQHDSTTRKPTCIMLCTASYLHGRW